MPLRTSTTPRLVVPFLAGLAGVAALASVPACSKKSDAPAPTTSASALAVSQPPGTAMVVKYDIVKDSKASLVGPAPVQTLKAETSAMEGSLDVDLMNLMNTRGVVKVDLLTLATKTFDSKAEDEKQTKDASGWLEVGPAVTPEMREKNRWADFAIRSIEDASVSNVTKVPAVREGADDVRSVVVKAKGDLLLHQLVAKDKPVTLDVKFHYPPGAAADSKPTSIVITTKEPFKIPIKDHDVKPRDAAGAIARSAFGLIGTKVAEVLDITFVIKAVPH
ncbi:MAG: hypothetical protein JWM74_1738 [Myxococcaceae bacterium]|nr:hypothetical protein [Myxococcaceae bacterium]